MRRSANSSPRPSLPSIPDGWFPIHPTRTQSPHEVTNYNSHVDGLGLAKGVDAAAIHVPHPFSNNTLQDERARGVRSSPRHRRLQQTHHQEPNERPLYTAADAFAPNRSLRLASIKPRLDKRDMGHEVLTLQPQQRNDADDGSDHFTRRSPKAGTLSARSRAARLRETHAPSVIPLHEVVRGFDDAVDASPQAESNQVAVTELFVASWMERFERERGLYKSIALHAEIAFRELYRLTANLASPNDVVTAFACKILDDMTEHFGPYATIVRVLSSELRQAIYATPSTPSVGPPVPYYAIVKNQKRILISLRKDQLRRQERNDFLRYEIDKVHETFLHFLDECGLGLVRTIFHEWYSVAVVSKRNTKKYIEYYSAWFGGSAKAMVPRLFLAWKCLSVETKVARMHEQLTLDQAKLASVQKQIEDFTVQRNLAQLESLAVRNDRKHAEDTIQRLHRKIQSASAFLEDTPRREALVAHEAQLRVEAATFLPPLVLESLLRGFHSVGFLQPLHSEFAGAKEGQLRRQTNPQLLGREHQQAFAMDGSALSQCIAALGRGHAATDGRENDLVTREIPLHDCVSYVQGIKSRVEDDPTAYLLFLPKAELAKAKSKSMAHRSHEKDNEDIDATAPTHKSPFRFQELVRQFNMALQNVRHQDEHYARHTKLFSSRMLEQSEITIVPYAPFSPQTEPPVSPQRHTSVQLPVSHQRVLFSSIDSARVAGSTYVVRGSVGEQDDTGDSRPLDHLPLLLPHDLELSPQQTRAFIVLTLGQLLIEYGSLLFSPTDLTAFVRNRMLHKIMLRGIAGGKHTLKRIYVPIPTDTEHEGDSVSDGSSSDDDDKDDDDEDKELDSLPTHSPKGTADTDKAAKGSDRMALSRKQATQRRMEIAPRRMSSYRGLHAPIADEIDRGLSHLKTAYDVWNRLTPQLTSNNVAAPATSALLDPRASVNGSIGSDGIASLLVTPEKSSTPFVALRPRLQLYVEPLPSGPLMTSAKERDRSETPSSSHRRSVMTMSPAPDWSYETSKVRHLSLTDTQQLVHAVQGLHAIVRSTAQQRAVAFTAAKKNLRILRATQWHHACDLASHFTCSVSSVATTAISPVTEIGTISEAPEDDRREVFECVTFENDAIERLFSVEDNPADELERVQTLLERKNHLVRHAFYCKHRPGTTHAASLDELCHVVKVLRLPRDVHVLPQLRDDELISTSYFGEHLFSPDDVAEVVLQLCNEQFLPQLTPLSARVEFFLTHHVPLAMQKPSAIREVMHTADVKKALSDHSYTLRTIFRRYCAKERDLLAAAAAKRRAAVVSTAANAAMYATSSSTTPAPAPPVVASAAPPGITKFMRLADWHDFIGDYKLLRARFTIEYATVVFCNVQEAESGLEDDLEMIFSEFSEAIVALAVCYFPDPFLRHATRVHQFIRRYVPVSPEDTRDHHS